MLPSSKGISEAVSSVLLHVLESDQESNGNREAANVVDGLFAIARGLEMVSKSIERLGTADAATPMGAVEMLSKEVRDGLERISASIGRGLTEIADSITLALEPPQFAEKSSPDGSAESVSTDPGE